MNVNAPRIHRRPELDLDRDNLILEHVIRDFLTTHEATHKRFFHGLTFDASRKVLRRLTKRKVLREYPLYANKSYFRLGSRAIGWGYPRGRGHALGELRLPYELGTLSYTFENEERLLPEELQDKLPWFPEELLYKWAYVWDKGKLGTVRVEFRRHAQAVVKKLAEQVYRYREIAELSKLIDARRFFFAVVTASDDQSVAIHHETREQKLGVEIRTIDDEELLHFM